MKPGRICNIPGCPSIAVKDGRCQKHKREPWSGRTWKDSPWSTPEGQRLRRQVLKEEPLCRKCGKPANSVDHIIPRARGGTHGRSNLQALCENCRRAKDAKDAARGRWGPKV